MFTRRSNIKLPPQRVEHPIPRTGFLQPGDRSSTPTTGLLPSFPARRRVDHCIVLARGQSVYEACRPSGKSSWNADLPHGAI